MLALSPLFSSTGGWPFEDPVTYNHHDGHQVIINTDHNNSSSCYNFNGGGGGGGSLLEAASTDYYFNIMEDYAAASDCFAYNSSHDHGINLLHHDLYSYEQQPPPLPPCNQHVDNNKYYNNPPPPLPAAGTIHAHHEVDNNTNNNNGGDHGHDGDDQYSPIPSTSIINVGVNHVVVKKLNHNASERDRRKKINSLYSSLRDLLPPSDHTKKLSIPETVSRVLKYIPELQQEVETLLKKKEELSPPPKANHEQEESLLNQPENPRRRRESAAHVQEAPTLSSVSASQMGENEIGVQISTLKYFDRGSIDVSDVLMQLENDGLNVLNVSSFESFGGRVFYNIHLWVEGANAIKCGLISEKILHLYRN